MSSQDHARELIGFSISAPAIVFAFVDWTSNVVAHVSVPLLLVAVGALVHRNWSMLTRSLGATCMALFLCLGARHHLLPTGVWALGIAVSTLVQMLDREVSAIKRLCANWKK